MQRVEDFLDVGCGCICYDGQPCSLRYTNQHVLSFRAECFELTKPELDLVLLGKLSATMHTTEIVGPSAKHKETQRMRNRTTYLHEGWQVCAVTFQFLHTVGKTTVTVK